MNFAWTPIFKELRKFQGRILDPNRWLSAVQFELKEIRTRRTIGRTTAAGGRFSFPNLPEGEYVVSISAKESGALQLVRVNSASSTVALDLTVFDTTCGLMIGPAR